MAAYVEAVTAERDALLAEKERLKEELAWVEGTLYFLAHRAKVIVEAADSRAKQVQRVLNPPPEPEKRDDST